MSPSTTAEPNGLVRCDSRRFIGGFLYTRRYDLVIFNMMIWDSKDEDSIFEMRLAMALVYGYTQRRMIYSETDAFSGGVCFGDAQGL
jgi:hypothetical protein